MHSCIARQTPDTKERQQILAGLSHGPGRDVIALVKDILDQYHRLRGPLRVSEWLALTNVVIEIEDALGLPVDLNHRQLAEKQGFPLRRMT